MKQYQIEANEQFFLQMKNSLAEGGKWVWPDHLKIYVKSGDKFESDEEGIAMVGEIVSPPFLAEHFTVVV